MSIGGSPTAAVKLFRRYGLKPFYRILDALLNDRPNRRWPKHMILIPRIVFWLMAIAALGDGSMAGAVISFWGPLRAVCPWLRAEPVKEEAFCIARRKLPVRFFRRLFQRLIDAFDAKFAGGFLWRGFRLLGLDGTETDLDPKLSPIYPPPSNQHGARKKAQARLVGLVDLWTGLCRAFRFVPLKQSEQRCASILARLLGPGDLLMADRNFPGIQLMLEIIRQGAQFLMHLPSKRYHKLPRRRTPSRKRNEWYITIPLSKARQKLFPFHGDGLQLRVLQYRKPGFRTSWLITSMLDTRRFAYDELVELYHERWRQETAHREWKHSLQLNNLRSKSNAGVLKEILVQLTLNNAIRWIMADAAVTVRRRPVDLKFLDAKRLILANVPVMAVARPDQLPGIYRQLLADIASHPILVRPGRNYPRKFDQSSRPKGHGTFASPARLATKGEIRYAAV
jgi:hypothetical protein